MDVLGGSMRFEGASAWQTLRAEIRPGMPPHHAADLVLRKMNVSRPWVDVEGIAERLGVRLVRDAELESIGKVDSTLEPPTIWVNAADSWARQRFTVAHELGHLMLHPLGHMYRDEAFSRPRNATEQQANDFSAALLMPLWMLEPIVTSSRRSTAELASLFNVSQSAMRFQLEKLI
jgi:Zn-dependent peptidase ImmA (M78 family)